MMNEQKKAPAATEAKCLETNLLNIPLCSGFGQHHSTSNKVEPKPYAQVSLSEIEQLTCEPPQVDKTQGQWVIFSSLASRVHKEQREQGEFYALWADIDEPQGITFDDAFERISATLEVETIGYTSRSATEERQKARFIFPLAQPVSGQDFVIMQKILNDKIEGLDITPDRVTERAGQLCYLPNRGEFYKADHSWEYEPLSPDLWGDELAEAYQAIEEAEQATKDRLELSRIKASQRMASGEKSPVKAFNAEYNWRDLWLKYGAQQVGQRFLSPYSESQSAAINELPDEPNKWVSHHGSDIANGVGRVSAAGDTCFGDAFDLFVRFENSGDYDAALKKAGAMFTDAAGRTITKQNQATYMEQHAAEEAAAALSTMFEDEPEQEEQPSQADAPVDLLHPPGLAGDICDYIRAKARREVPELYPLAALHLMALVGRNKASVYTNKLNLITIGIAPTAAGKEAPQNAIKTLAREAYCSDKIHGNAGSFKELIINLIEGDGAALYTVDEVHSLLGSMKNANAATYETKMEAEILTMSATDLYTFRGADRRTFREQSQKRIDWLEKKLESVDDDSEDFTKLSHALEKENRKLEFILNGWPNPFFSLMGHSVPERMDAFANADNIASGFLGRSLIARCSEQRSKLKRGKRSHHAGASLEQGILYSLSQIGAIRGIVDVTDEAHEYLERCIDWYEEDEQLNHHIVGGIYARAPEQLYKVASILGLDGGLIQLEHARYAHALVKASIDNVRYLMLKAYAESTEASEQAVLRAAKETALRNCKGSGVTESRLRQLITKPNAFREMQLKDRKRDRAQELIETLLESGELELIEQGRRKRFITKAVV